MVDHPMATLLVLGNTNQHTFANSIVAANHTSSIQMGGPLQEIYVLHTSESQRALAKSGEWVEHLRTNGVQQDIITYRTIELDVPSAGDAVAKFAKYVESAVHASGAGQLIVDLSNGTTAYKTLLSTVAYVLDVPHLYMIDISRLKRSPGEQLGFLPLDVLTDIYVRAPDSTILDVIAHLSMTEVVRYGRIVDAHAGRYRNINPAACDEEFFKKNLVHSVQIKLQGDRQRQRDNAIYRIASTSIAASIEELVRVLMSRFLVGRVTDEDRLTFGQRLAVLREHMESNPKPDFDYEFFRQFNDFMLYLRNSTTHKGKILTDVERFKADLAVKMSFPFLEFYSDIVFPTLSISGPTSAAPIKIRRYPTLPSVRRTRFLLVLMEMTQEHFSRISSSLQTTKSDLSSSAKP
jgi:hypothetical protein